MSNLSRWLAPLVIAAGFGTMALAPTAARAAGGDDLIRVLVDVADVVLRGDQPYYRNGNYGYNDRLIVVRDNRGQPRYYRDVPRRMYVNNYRPSPAYRDRDVKCNKHGKCKVKTQTTYYDPRYDRDRRGKHRHR
ncbi:hypothetical protein [Novilysobacter antarcticus]|uniref:hypothetical protein n=1 Tax=Novilysobacter antarcticus TaxID=2862543 RepID=UPI001C994F9C|nr:hypothetical protein [Lysobacter antarcticus]